MHKESRSMIAGDLVLVTDESTSYLDRILQTRYSERDNKIYYILKQHEYEVTEEVLELPSFETVFPDLISVLNYLKLEFKEENTSLLKELSTYNSFLLCSKAFTDYNSKSCQDLNNHSFIIGAKYYTFNLETETIDKTRYFYLGQALFHTEKECRHAIEICGGEEKLLKSAVNWNNY